MELLKGELERFTMLKGEGPQEMYNLVKGMVNQICNYGSKKCMDLKVVKLMLRSFTSYNLLLQP